MSDTNPCIAQMLYRLQTGGAEKLSVQLCKSVMAAEGRFEMVFYGTRSGGALEEELHYSGVKHSHAESNHYSTGIAQFYPRFLRNFSHAIDFCKKHDVKLLHTHVGHSTEMGMFLKMALGIPYIVTLHSPQIIPLGIKQGTLKWKLRGGLLLKSLTKADRLIAVSNEVADCAVEFGKGNLARPKVITNGILPPELPAGFNSKSLRTELGFQSSDTILIAVGRLVENKGQRVLIETLQHLRLNGYSSDFKLLLVGDGPDLEHLKSLSKKLEVSDRVVFLGDRTDVPSLVSASDIFVSGSKFEGLSLAILEAMALEKAIVATPAPGTVEALAGHAGLISDEHTAKSLYLALDQVLQDKSKREQLAKNAAEKFQNNYLIDKMSASYLKEYRAYIS